MPTRRSTLDRLGGVGWQTRKAKVKERIRELAGELIKVAAERQLRKGTALDLPHGVYEEFAARFPYEETEDQLAAIEAVLEDMALGPADGPADLRRCRLRQDRGGAARRVRRRHGRQAGGAAGADHAARAPALPRVREPLRGPAGPRGAALALRHRPRRRREVKKGLADGQIDIVVGTHALLGKGVQLQEPGPRHRRRGAAFRRRPQGEAEAAAGRGPRADHDRDPDPAHAAHGAGRDEGPLDHRHAAGRPAGGAHLRHAGRPGGAARGDDARALSRRAVLLRLPRDQRPGASSSEDLREAGAGAQARDRQRPDAGAPTSTR